MVRVDERVDGEAFARPIEWFGLDECEMTERGLSTPAVERIVQAARNTPRAARWSPGKARKGPDADARARGLLRRLADARKVDSVVVVRRVCGEIADLTGVSAQTQGQLMDAVQEARDWLGKQAGARRDLCARLDQAVNDGNAKQVWELLILVNATAAHDRTETEDNIVERASDYFAGLAHSTRELLEAEAAAERAATEAVGPTAVLASLRQRSDLETGLPRTDAAAGSNDDRVRLECPGLVIMRGSRAERVFRPCTAFFPNFPSCRE
ncbi:hypothetical protein KQY30_31370 [Streptomyces sp. GMY02]|uniref:hypothetical protein n=1 Tax=Streptomyces sp. GMY02 TaxID=1333528 RepID=UPI001C2C4AAE|nr:hypothetical protein [Streptomyces sp. GMY02]QXE38062.1 hypothetical protein KQY30_31370 [Streptomyces sp. GMY02]